MSAAGYPLLSLTQTAKNQRNSIAQKEKMKSKGKKQIFHFGLRNSNFPKIQIP